MHQDKWIIVDKSHIFRIIYAIQSMNKNMEQLLDNRGEQNERESMIADSALAQEIYRAMEMMKRVKKSNAAQFENSSESQRMPSYLMPDAFSLCQTGD